MFSGIIKILGEVKSINDIKYKKSNLKRFNINFSENLEDLKIGESISVDGVCLTVVEIGQFVSFDVMPETLKLTSLGEIKQGARVNCERSLRFNDLIGGHLVSGHVDFVTQLIDINEDNEFYFDIVPDFEKYFVRKGSVTINGVSLTVSGVIGDTFKVSLIPETLQSTNLGDLSIGSKVNIEIDLIARYLENLI